MRHRLSWLAVTLALVSVWAVRSVFGGQDPKG